MFDGEAYEWLESRGHTVRRIPLEAPGSAELKAALDREFERILADPKAPRDERCDAACALAARLAEEKTGLDECEKRARSRRGAAVFGAALRLAQINLVAAQDNVAVNEALEDAQSAYEEALHDYDYWLNEYNENDADYWFVDDAKQKLDDAKLALDRAQQRADQILQSARNDLAQAADLYSQAQNDLDDLLAGPDAGDLESLELDMQMARLNLAAAQENLANATLTAPFAGVVVAVEAEAGETVGTAPIVILADLDHPLVRLTIDEAVHDFDDGALPLVSTIELNDVTVGRGRAR